ncbi:unnamed protein product [Symbiodinium sp. CCMP2456]|nr:unnamed protein product [Symbiodinium sp. CCMP2456]
MTGQLGRAKAPPGRPRPPAPRLGCSAEGAGPTQQAPPPHPCPSPLSSLILFGSSFSESSICHRSFEERGFEAARDRRRLRPYWPPQAGTGNGERLAHVLRARAKRWSFLEAASRPRVQVLTAKSDVDGALEAQLAFLTRGGHRLFYLNEEELAELEKLAPRISEYFELWEEKAKEAAESEDSKRLHKELRQRPLE